MKIRDLSPIIRKLLAAFPHANASEETLGVYVKYLADIPLDHLSVVVDQCIMESEFLPTVAKIRQRYISMVTPERLSASDAWGLVQGQIIRTGHLGQPEFDDATVARVVRGMGWRELCLSENQIADRAHFMKLYEEQADRQQVQYRESNATRLLTAQQRELGAGNPLGPAPQRGLVQIGSIMENAMPKRGENNLAMTDTITVGARVTWARSRWATTLGIYMSGVVRAICVDDDGYEYAVVETDPDGRLTMPELNRLVVEDERAMNELSLFSGAGGGLLASLLLGWKTIGYVEIDDYCQRVLAQRIADGILPVAPIFGDVREFILSGAAAEYRGFVDVVSGGFPCQPFSVAGKRAGADDERNMWPATAECVRIIRPRYCFFENVVALLSSGYFGTIVADLAALGYCVRWGVLSACTVGAPHTRERLFIVADSSSGATSGRGKSEPGAQGIGRGEASEWGQYTAKDVRSFRSQIWDSDETDILRIPNGMGSKLERIGAIGNGQVPAVAATAWTLLTG